MQPSTAQSSAEAHDASASAATAGVAESDDALIRANLSLNLECCVVENHRKPLYCVRFNHAQEEYGNYFASVGANQATVYRVDDSGAMNPVQSFVDQDKYEKFYSCEWAASDRGTPLLAVAGLRGMIKVIDCVTFELAGILVGHGNAVNDVKVHPIDCGLLLSAGKDESIRLWNIRTWTCAAIFAGDKGHRDEILSIVRDNCPMLKCDAPRPHHNKRLCLRGSAGRPSAGELFRVFRHGQHDQGTNSVAGELVSTSPLRCNGFDTMAARTGLEPRGPDDPDIDQIVVHTGATLACVRVFVSAAYCCSVGSRRRWHAAV